MVLDRLQDKAWHTKAIRNWDCRMDFCRDVVFKVRIKVARRRKKRVHHLQRTISESASTQKHIVTSTAESLEQERSVRRGSRLHRSAADVR